MTKSLIRWILISILASLSVAASAQLYQWTEYSQSQVIQAVRDFEGNPNLDVTVISAPDATLGPPAAHYVLRAGRYEYQVGKYSLGCFIRLDRLTTEDRAAFYGGTYSDAELAQRMMTESQAEDIARTFMMSHYPEPSLLEGFRSYGIRGHGNSNFGMSFLFHFYQVPTVGVEGPSFVSVEVDSVMGQVVSYISINVPLLVSTTPSLTGEDAASMAVSSLGMTDATLEEVRGLVASRPDPLGVEYLAYNMTIFASGPPDYTSPHRYRVTVDAHYGGVLDWDIMAGVSSAQSLKKKLNAGHKPSYSNLDAMMDGHAITLGVPPLLIDKQAFVYVGYLCYRDPKATITRKDPDTVVVAGALGTIELGTKSRECVVYGKTKKLPYAPVTVNGRLYVPPSAFSYANTPLKVSFDAKHKRVVFVSQTRKTP